MTDFFDLLREPRRPWLDPEALKQNFFALSSGVHPDRIHSSSENEKAAGNRRFAELNAAYNCLREPKSRLLHLLQLERGSKPEDIHQLPQALSDLFLEIATLCRQVDRFIAERQRVVSPLAQVKQFEQAHEQADLLGKFGSQLREFHERLIVDLKSVDAEWMTGPSAATRSGLLTRLEELYRSFGYFNKWNSQIQERIIQLTL